jgi:hypothetical protein
MNSKDGLYSVNEGDQEWSKENVSNVEGSLNQRRIDYVLIVIDTTKDK